MALEIDRRTFLSMAALAGLDTGVKGLKIKSGERPNFLIMMADQHSPHFLGCYGNKIVRTPNLDRLARRGALFEHAYCQAPLCVPSRTSFLTGLQPSQNRVWINSDSDWLPSGAPTFAHALGAVGYDTTLIGRMHFGGRDQWHGFQRRLVGDVMNPYTDTQDVLSSNLAQGAGASGPSLSAISGPGKTAYQVYDQDVTKAAVDFFEDPKNTQRPFLTVVGFVLPHSPYVCSPEEWKYYSDRVTLADVPTGDFNNVHPAIRAWRKARGFDNVTPEAARRALVSYYGLVSELDRNVGSILDALDNTKAGKNTCVIYVSDHGEMAGEHGIWGKMVFYEGAVTVPFLMACPSLFPQAAKLPQIVSLVDIAPTLCEMAGTNPMPAASGASLVSLLEQKPASWPNQALSELPVIDPSPATRMVRKDQWKLVNYSGMRPQLFNLENDPQEMHDLGEDPACAQIREELIIKSSENWTPGDDEKIWAYRAETHRLVQKWARAVGATSPTLWRAPANANLFPE